MANLINLTSIILLVFACSKVSKDEDNSRSSEQKPLQDNRDESDANANSKTAAKESKQLSVDDANKKADQFLTEQYEELSGLVDDEKANVYISTYVFMFPHFHLFSGLHELFGKAKLCHINYDIFKEFHENHKALIKKHHEDSKALAEKYQDAKDDEKKQKEFAEQVAELNKKYVEAVHALLDGFHKKFAEEREKTQSCLAKYRERIEKIRELKKAIRIACFYDFLKDGGLEILPFPAMPAIVASGAASQEEAEKELAEKVEKYRDEQQKKNKDFLEKLKGKSESKECKEAVENLKKYLDEN